MVDPLWMSATAASASRKSLEPPRSILGARDGLGAAVEYVDARGAREAGRSDTAARTPR